MTRMTALTAAPSSLLLLAIVAAAPSAAAREPLTPPTSQSMTSAWAEPIDALGGISLAVYVAQHQARVLGEPGV